jgi:hypothetical protein
MKLILNLNKKFDNLPEHHRFLIFLLIIVLPMFVINITSTMLQPHNALKLQTLGNIWTLSFIIFRLIPILSK